MKSSTQAENPGIKRRLRGVNLALVCCALVLLLAPLVPYTLAAVSPDSATAFWDHVRHGTIGATQIKGTESGQLINESGTWWLEWRNQWVSPGGAWALSLSLVTLTLVYLLIGTNRMPERSGKTIERWSRMDRTIHWFMAITFLLLGVTGLSILYGKSVLIPMMGKDAFASFLYLAKNVHNYLGPLFSLALVVMAIKWLKHNFFTLVDMKWFATLGGMIGKGHAPADFTNGGEKAWFWVLVLLGLVVSGSGLVLDFPNYGQIRETMQNANLIHAISAVVLFCGSLFHIYMGTLGVEGALEGMVSGEVDEAWAEQHHSLWVERVKQNG
ncbi:formate dehydrogenase subunit gamma [Aestuariirhabdus litorea]|nr:formate dehydrogenase subunit gamma [Aestuariirhabdus litorea]